jgi:hypothetical protein
MPTTQEMQSFLRTGILAIDQTKTGEPWTKFREDLTGVQRDVEDFSKQQSAILNDVALTDSGKRDRLQAAAQVKANQMSWWWKKPGELAAAQERLTNLLFAPIKRPAGDATLMYLRERELRDGLKGKSQTQIDGIFYEAVAGGKDELLRALIDGPGGALPSEAARQAIADQQARTQNPEAFAALEDLKNIRELLELMMARSARWLTELGADLSNKANVVVHA